MLFQRVKQIAQELAESETKLAVKLSLPQRKFNGYLTPISEKNLWQYLPRILELYPQVSEQWLYFGRGEMLDGNGKRVAAIPQEGHPQTERIAALEQKNSYLRELLASKDETITSLKDALASKDENIAMQKQMLRQAMPPLTQDNPALGASLGGAMDTPALGVRTSTDKTQVGR